MQNRPTGRVCKRTRSIYTCGCLSTAGWLCVHLEGVSHDALFYRTETEWLKEPCGRSVCLKNVPMTATSSPESGTTTSNPQSPELSRAEPLPGIHTILGAHLASHMQPVSSTQRMLDSRPTPSTNSMLGICSLPDIRTRQGIQSVPDSDSAPAKDHLQRPHSLSGADPTPGTRPPQHYHHDISVRARGIKSGRKESPEVLYALEQLKDIESEFRIPRGGDWSQRMWERPVPEQYLLELASQSIIREHEENRITREREQDYLRWKAASETVKRKISGEKTPEAERLLEANTTSVIAEPPKKARKKASKSAPSKNTTTAQIRRSFSGDNGRDVPSKP